MCAYSNDSFMTSSRVCTPSFVKFTRLLTTYDFALCMIDLIVMCKTTSSESLVLVVYINDILLTVSDDISIYAMKSYLH